MKICHISSYYIGSNLYQKLIYALNKICIENKVYCFVSNKYSKNREFDDFVEIRKTFRYFERFNYISKHLNTFYDFENYIGENEKFDIFHAHSLVSNGYIAYRANKKYNIPYVVAVRNTDMNFFLSKIPFSRPIARKILNNASKVVFISKPYHDNCIKKYVKPCDRKSIEEKSIILTNGIDEMFFNDVKLHKPSENVIKIISVGVINKNKNITTTIKACELLIERGYCVELNIIGKIADKNLSDLILKPFIKYTEQIEQSELIKKYAESDIFVMPSKHETFGLVYAEAMTQGLPVIYTREQGFDGNFDNGEVGFSVKYDDYKEIAEKILEIKENYSKISNNCIKYSKKFDWSIIAQKYKEIYKEIL